MRAHEAARPAGNPSVDHESLAVGKATRVEDVVAMAPPLFTGDEQWEPIDADAETPYEQPVDIGSLASDVAGQLETTSTDPTAVDTPADTAADKPRTAKSTTPAPGAGRPIFISFPALLDGVRLTKGLQTLIKAMVRDNLRVADAPRGLAMLRAVFAHTDNLPALQALGVEGDPTAWLSRRLTASIPTRESYKDERGKTKYKLRSRNAVAKGIVRFLLANEGSQVLIDEAGKGRFELVRDVARKLAPRVRRDGDPVLRELDITPEQYQQLRGRWGAYLSAKPGGIKHGKPVREALAALRDAGADVVVEGYAFGTNPWPTRRARLAESKATIAALRPFIKNPSVAVGADAKRVGIDYDKCTIDGGKNPQFVALTRKLAKAKPGQKPPLITKVRAARARFRENVRPVFLRRIAEVFEEARRAKINAPLGSWVSRLDGDEAADDAELQALLG